MLRNLLLAVMCSVGIKNCDIKTDINVQKLNVRNISEHLLQNSGVELLEQTETNLGVEKQYTMGAHTNRDNEIGSATESKRWFMERDVQLTVFYPKEGSGNIVTCVEIFVEQSSNLGNAYVVAGGIGQRNIAIVIEAFNTTFFESDVRFYGY